MMATQEMNDCSGCHIQACLFMYFDSQVVPGVANVHVDAVELQYEVPERLHIRRTSLQMINRGPRILFLRNHCPPASEKSQLHG